MAEELDLGTLLAHVGVDTEGMDSGLSDATGKLKDYGDGEGKTAAKGAGVKAGGALSDGIASATDTKGVSEKVSRSGAALGGVGNTLGSTVGKNLGKEAGKQAGKMLGDSLGSALPQNQIVQMLAPFAGLIAAAMAPAFATMISGWFASAAAAETSAFAMATAWVVALGPIVLIVAGVVALVAVLVVLWMNSETFRDIVTGAFNAVWGAIQNILSWCKEHWPLLLAILTGPIGLAVLAIATHWDEIKQAAYDAYTWLTGLFSSFWNGLTDALASAVQWIMDKIDAVVKKVQDAKDKVTSAATLGLSDSPVDRLRAEAQARSGGGGGGDRALGMADGGIIPPSRGGTLVRAAEAGKREVFAPLGDLLGMIRDAVPAAGVGNVRVFIGDRELTDIVRVEVDGAQGDLGTGLGYGATG